MKIQYTKKRMKINLIIGLFWLLLSVFELTFNDFNSWIDYGSIVIAMLYIGTYFYEYFNHYLTIENGIIKMNRPFGKKIILTEINQFKKFASNYILKTDNVEIIINTEIINQELLMELNTALEILEVK